VPQLGWPNKLKRFAGAHRQCSSPSLTMFTGLCLRICFCFGRQQQTVTITTPGATDVQLESSSQYVYQHPYATFFRFFSHFADTSQSEPNSSRLLLRANLGIGQVSLPRQGNAQRRRTPHIRTSTRRAIVGVIGQAKSGTNSTVRRFLRPGRLTPR